MLFVIIFFLPVESDHPAVGTPTTNKTATFDLQHDIVILLLLYFYTSYTFIRSVNLGVLEQKLYPSDHFRQVFGADHLCSCYVLCYRLQKTF